MITWEINDEKRGFGSGPCQIRHSPGISLEALEKKAIKSFRKDIYMCVYSNQNSHEATPTYKL